MTSLTSAQLVHVQKEKQPARFLIKKSVRDWCVSSDMRHAHEIYEVLDQFVQNTDLARFSSIHIPPTLTPVDQYIKTYNTWYKERLKGVKPELRKAIQANVERVLTSLMEEAAAHANPKLTITPRHLHSGIESMRRWGLDGGGAA